MRQRFRGKHNEEEKKQPHDGEGEHMEALPSAAKLYVNTFMHSLDLTYGFVKLLSVHLPMALEGDTFKTDSLLV